MKLETLRMVNINSLKGEHFIDFSAPPLSECSMFLITGPTGSGKTTILDAITAALYDRTPRLGKGTKALKSQTAERAMIELCYTAGGARYRNVWQLDKRDNKKISVYKNGEPIAGLKVNGLADKTREIIGADYDAFVKTIVLAQNKFDEFIKSRPEERRQIIESITDNTALEAVKKKIKDEYDSFEIKYGELRQRVQAFETLAGATDPKALARELELKQSALKNAKAAAEAAAGAKNEYDILKGLHEELAALEAKLKKMDEDYDFAAALSEITRLRTARDLFGAAVPELKNAAARLEDKKKAAAAESEKLEALCLTLETARSTLETAKRAREDFDAAYAKKIAGLSAARSLAGPLEEAERAEAAAAGKCSELSAELAGAEKALAAINAGLAATAAEKKALEDKKSAFGGMYETFGEEALAAFREAAAAAKSMRDELTRAGAEIAGLESEIRSETSKLAGLRENEKKFSMDSARLAAEKKAAEDQKKLLEEEFEQSAVRGAAAALREKLAPGEKCPVCGSREHPDAGAALPGAREARRIKSDIRECDALIKKLEAELGEAAGNASACKATIKAAGENVDSKTARAAILKEAYGVRAAGLAEIKRSLTAPFPIENEDYAAAAERWAADIKALAAIREKTGALENRMAVAAAERAGAESAAARSRSALEAAEKEAASIKLRKESLKNEIEKFAGTGNLDELEKRLEGEKKSVDGMHARAAEAFSAAGAAVEASRRLIESLEAEIARLAQSFEKAKAAFERALEESGFDEKTALALYGRLNSLNRMESEYNEKMIFRSGVAASAAGVREKIAGRPFEESVLNELTEAARRAAGAVELLNREAGGIEAALARHAAIAAEYEAARALFERNGAEHETLERLYLLTKENQFRDFVLSFYLKNLLLLSNQYLKTLTGGRYELSFDLESSNAIFIRDYFNEGREREINTVSGGEGFMASLSLALGLSLVSSGGGRIEFMFLDEGFGVLDSNTLEDVLDMISKLNDSGRKIGIISHIQQVKDRIDTRIELTRNNDGTSALKVTGA